LFSAKSSPKQFLNLDNQLFRGAPKKKVREFVNQGFDFFVFTLIIVNVNYPPTRAQSPGKPLPFLVA